MGGILQPLLRAEMSGRQGALYRDCLVTCVNPDRGTDLCGLATWGDVLDIGYKIAPS